ncbi:MAG: RNA polymerase sigma factor [Acholeplasmatales bacterium]|nr:RNA polymerase sigma factor [Acholeplasmatales bacterium]
MTFDEFVKEFKENNYIHFKEFYDLTSKNVYFTAYGILKDSDLANDILQETYMTFLEKIDDYKNGKNVYAYLSMIARNKSINLYNRDKRIVSNEEIVINKYDDSNDYKKFNEILSYLDDELDREIIIYHIILDYTFKKIAQIIDMPLGTTLWRYNKALKTLKERIGDNYER